MTCAIMIANESFRWWCLVILAQCRRNVTKKIVAVIEGLEMGLFVFEKLQVIRSA